jgi:GxxExxY protein
MAIVYRSHVAEAVIGCALEVHTQLGPGLMESAYRQCLAHELKVLGLAYRPEVAIPVLYKGVPLDCGYRADFVVANTLLLEIKSVAQLLPVHSAQTLTYLKLARVEQALLLNFNVARLKEGIKSFLSKGEISIKGDRHLGP